MSNTGTTKADVIGAAVQKVDGLEVGKVYTDEEFVKAIDPDALDANSDPGDESDWLGVYPDHCINPETCRGKSHCPRDYSCVE